MSSRVPRNARLLGVYGTVIGSLALFWVVITGADRRSFTIDSVILVAGQELSLQCLSNRVFMDCYGHLPDQVLFTKYPLLQTIPAWLLWTFTRDEPASRAALIWINAAILAVAIVGFALWVWRRYDRRYAILAVVLAVCGMVIPYATYSFGEPLALVALGFLCVAALGRRHTSRWFVVLAAVAVMGKETFFPCVLLFGMGSLLLAPCTNAVRRRRALHLVTGVAAGFGLSSVYNVFRYGSLRNLGYSNEPLAGFDAVPGNVLGQLVAPNAGIVWFWPGVLFALVILVAFALAPRRSESDRLARRGVVMILGGFAAGLLLNAAWWAPYGWYAWGPRLLFPYCAPLLIAAIVVLGRQRNERWFRGGRLLAVGVACSLALVPSIGVVWTPQRWISHIEAQSKEDRLCDMFDHGYAEAARCQNEEAWRTSFMPLVWVVPTDRDQPSYWVVWMLGVSSVWALLGSTYTRPRGLVPVEEWAQEGPDELGEEQEPFDDESEEEDERAYGDEYACEHELEEGELYELEDGYVYRYEDGVLYPYEPAEDDADTGELVPV